MQQRRIAAGLAALLLAAGLSACAPEPVTPPKPTTSAPPTTASPSPTETPAPTTAPPTTPPPAPWERFTDPRVTHSFEIPPGWTVQDLGSANDMGIVQLGVFDPAGTQRLIFMNRVQGLGGACGALPVMTVEELAAQPVEIPGYTPAAEPPGLQLVGPKVVFRAAPVAEGVLASLALADDVLPDSCMYVNLLHTDAGPTLFGTSLQVDTYEPSSQWLFGSMDEARAYQQSEDYAQLVRILGSLRIAG